MICELCGCKMELHEMGAAMAHRCDICKAAGWGGKAFEHQLKQLNPLVRRKIQKGRARAIEKQLSLLQEKVDWIR